jgi:G3E family GTPase
MLFDGNPGQPWAEGEVRRNRMVFIGRNLDRKELQERFNSCLVTELSK